MSDRRQSTWTNCLTAASFLASTLVASLAAHAALPPPNHPFDFGYYQMDGNWGPNPPGNGDYGSEVNCYTNAFYATRFDHGDNWAAPLAASIERAAAADKVIELALDFDKEPLQIPPGGTCPAGGTLPEQLATVGQILDLAAPNWDRVERLELVGEPSWRTDQSSNEEEGLAFAAETNCRVSKLQELLATRGLAPRPIGITHQAKWFADLPSTAMEAANLDWVGISAYLTGIDDTLPLAELRDRFNKRMAKAVKWSGGKPIVWVMQAYDLTHTWNNLPALVELQRWTYEMAATESVSDPEVGTFGFETDGLLLFSYARDGGTRSYPALAAVHREMAAAIFGLPSPPTCGNPPSTGPSNLQITGAFGSFLDLAWLAGTQPANLYRLFLHNGDGVWQAWGDIAGSQTAYTTVVGLPGLPGVGLTRCFKVRGFYGNGTPLDSNEVCTRVFRDPPVAPPVPQSPRGCVNTTRPTLHWDTVPDATGYYVVVKRLVDGAFVINDPNVTDNSYAIADDLERGFRHAWKVKACNNQGCSLTYSPFVDFTPVCDPRADFNGDARNDLVIRDAATGNHSAWLLDGTTRLAVAPFSPAKPAAGNWTLVGAHDFDLDRRPDLLWRNTDSGNFALWRLNGVTRTAGQAFPGNPDLANRVVGTGDFNHDGRPDVVWHHAATGALSVTFFNGASLSAPSPLGPGSLSTSSEVAAIGDIDGDRDADLLLRNLTTGALETWWFDGIDRTAVAPLTSTGTPDAGWRIVALEDLNRDGFNDIVWQNVGTNRLVAWFLSGSGVTHASGGFLTPDGSSEADQKAVGPR